MPSILDSTTGKFIAADLSGKTVGRLTVIKRVENSSEGRPMWLCRCSCGTEKPINAEQLYSKRKPTVSCGCFRHELLTKPRLKARKSETGFTRLIRSYKKEAEVRCLEFKLTTEDFKNLTSSNCVYCGQAPATYVKDYNKVTSSRGRILYVYNGIDRVDNNRGYTLDNSVSCCEVCNLAKNDRPVAEFLSWIQRLIKFQTKDSNENQVLVAPACSGSVNSGSVR